MPVVPATVGHGTARIAAVTSGPEAGSRRAPAHPGGSIAVCVGAPVTASR